MNDNTVKTFRQQVYACFVKGQDSLLNLVDARAREDRAQSLPELSRARAFYEKTCQYLQSLETGAVG